MWYWFKRVFLYCKFFNAKFRPNLGLLAVELRPFNVRRVVTSFGLPLLWPPQMQICTWWVSPKPKSFSWNSFSKLCFIRISKRKFLQLTILVLWDAMLFFLRNLSIIRYQIQKANMFSKCWIHHSFFRNLV